LYSSFSLLCGFHSLAGIPPSPFEKGGEGDLSLFQVSKTHSWQPGKKPFRGNHMINTGVNPDLTVNTVGLYDLNNPFAVEKPCESLKRL